MRRLFLVSRRPAIAAFGAGIAFVALTLLYKAGSLQALDSALTPALRGIRGDALDTLGELDSRLFGPPVAAVLTAVLAIALWRFGPRWSWLAPGFLGVSSLLDYASRQGFAVFLHPRQLAEATVLLLVGGHVSGLGGYPSGHTERAAFLAVLCLAYLPRTIALPIAVLAATTVFARVYTGAHRVSEVVGGVCLGVSVAMLAVWAVSVIGTLMAPRPSRLRPEASQQAINAGAIE